MKRSMKKKMKVTGLITCPVCKSSGGDEKFLHHRGDAQTTICKRCGVIFYRPETMKLLIQTIEARDEALKEINDAAAENSPVNVSLDLANKILPKVVQPEMET